MLKTNNKLKSILTNWDLVITNEKYQVLASTPKYAVVLTHESFRVENWTGMYNKEVPYVEVPHELADLYLEDLLGYQGADPGYKREVKADGRIQFNESCDQMFDDEHTELYPESVI